MASEPSGKVRGVIPGTLVLLASPVLAPGSWAELPDALEAADPSIEVLDVVVTDDDQPPFGQRYVTAVVLAARAASPRVPLVLVAHDAAGPLVPAIGRALRDAGHRVGAYVFVDADLPGPGRPSRLDLLRRDTDGRAVVLEAVLATGAGYPDRGPGGVGVRSRDRAFFDEPLPTGEDWPDAPCGYLRTSAHRGAPARRVRARGWPVVEVGSAADDDEASLAWVENPSGVATALLELIERL